MMNLFKKEVAPDISGSEALRIRLRAWQNQPGRWAPIVRDTKGLGPAALDAFANGADNLSIEVLKDLTRVMLGGYVIFDAESGMLKSAYADDPPALAGIPPEPYVNPDPTIAQAQAAYRAALKAARGPERRGPQLAKPELVQTTTKRAGFLGDFFPVAVQSPEAPRKEKFVRVRQGPEH